MPHTSTGSSGGRPMIMALNGIVSAGHYLASGAAIDVLRRGGNAFDAAAAAAFTLHVVLPNQNGIAGEVPILLYHASDDAVLAVSGHGIAPAAATIDHFRGLNLDVVPGDGLLPAVVPPPVATWLLVLRRFGTLRLADILATPIGLAEHGFPMFDALRDAIAKHADRFRRDWPSSAQLYLPGNAPPPLGAPFKQPELARTLKLLRDADQSQKDREAGLRAAHDVFYRGPIARRIDEFCRTSVPDVTGQSHTGLLHAEDLAKFEAHFEQPLSVAYRAMRVYKCPSWTQGPVLLQGLSLLEGIDLGKMGHNSPDYIHHIIEAMKLAYADREFYYGDPNFVNVPMQRLLSKPYAHRRREMIDPAKASMELRPGDLPAISPTSIRDVNRAVEATTWPSGDTTSIQVIDRWGNIVSAVPSGGWLMDSPVIPGLGFPLGTRGQMFSLTPKHPNALVPGKRPRTTLTPSLAGFEGRPPHMAFASPGGDSQDQWNLQFFLNVVEFDLPLQHAAEAPTFWTEHFPSSFYPRRADPGSLYIESRIDQKTRDQLQSRGHRIKLQPPWSGGNIMAAAIDRRTGVLSAAASPRYDPAYAIGF